MSKKEDKKMESNEEVNFKPSDPNVNWIKARIKSEYTKHHEHLDWSLIAALKIVATLKESYDLVPKTKEE